jgi:DNA-binding MarR family transcriptional regulator
MNAGELIILGRQLTQIGTVAMRGARDPKGAIPGGVAIIGSDVLVHPETSVGDIARRTGLRPGYVSESVDRLRDQGVLETVPDPDDGRRVLVRLTGGHPERVSKAAAAPVDQALRDALGPGTDGATARTILAALIELAERLGTPESGPGEDPPPTRTDLTRSDLTRADATRADATRADRTRMDATRADLTRTDLTRTDLTRSDVTRSDVTRSDR